MVYQCKVKIIPYVITLERIVTAYHKKYFEEIGISNHIQTKVLKKTLETISSNYLRRTEESRSMCGGDH